MSSSSVSTRRRRLAFAAILAAGVMDLLDSSVANIAAPSIRTDLGGTYADLEWITVGYTLAMAVTLLVGARLGDMLGRRRLLLGGMAGFALASIGCAVAGSPEVLVGARVVQGAFGALMLPQIFGLIREIFGPADMGKALGVLGPVMGLAAILGPIVAGALIGADVLGTGWRMIFLVNVPVAMAALAIGVRTLPAGARSAGVRLDARGAVLAAVGTGLLVYPLVQGRELGWPAWILGLLAVSVPVLGLFAAGQIRRKRGGGSPLVEPSVFSHRSFVAGIAFALVFLGSMGGVVLIVGVFLQAGLGYTPIHAALTSAPWALGAFLGSGAASAVMQRLGRRVLHIGLAVMGGGLAWLAVVLAQQGTAVGSWDFAAPLLVSGVGMGAIWVPLFDIVLGGVADHELGSASGVLQAVQQLGMSLGVAVIGTLFFGLLGSHVGHVADFVAAARITLLVTTGLIAVAFVVAFGLPRHAKGHEAAEAGGAVPEPSAA